MCRHGESVGNIAPRDIAFVVGLRVGRSFLNVLGLAVLVCSDEHGIVVGCILVESPCVNESINDITVKASLVQEIAV